MEEEKTYHEKLRELLDDKSSEPIEWRQSNEEINGHIESEVVFKFKKTLSEKQEHKNTIKSLRNGVIGHS